MRGYLEFIRNWYGNTRFKPPDTIEDMLSTYTKALDILFTGYRFKYPLSLKYRSALDFAEHVLRVLANRPSLLAQVLLEMARLYPDLWPDAEPDKYVDGMNSLLDLTRVEQSYGHIPEVRGLIEEIKLLRRQNAELERFLVSVSVVPPKQRYIRVPTAMSRAIRARKRAERRVVEQSRKVVTKVTKDDIRDDIAKVLNQMIARIHSSLSNTHTTMPNSVDEDDSDPFLELAG